MGALILSDSHGNIEMMKEAVDRTGPDVILHLGDCWLDVDKLQKFYPDIPIYRVPGNNDYDRTEPRDLEITLEGHNVFLCHGDIYGVNNTLGGLGMLAREKQIDLLLFGHTHRPFKDLRDSTLYLNPGSIGAPEKLREYSYAVAFLMEGVPVSAWLKTIDG